MTDRHRAVDTAAEFVRAIQWGEHTTLWELLSGDGRTTALSVAQRNGLDRVTAARIQDGLCDPVDLDEFLRRLLGGLRRDLRSVDIDQLDTVGTVEAGPGDAVTVELTNPSLLPGTDHWTAGSLQLSADDTGTWRVDRLVPRLAGP